MKVREKINLFIDPLLTLALTFIAGIGFLIKYTLPLRKIYGFTMQEARNCLEKAQ